MSRRAFQLRRRSIGFSLIELLVIIAILAVLAGAGIPAIRNMIYTSTGSMAESQLRFGLGAARDLAIRNSGGDTAAVFTFEPGGRMMIIPMVYVGQIVDTTDPSRKVGIANAPTAYRDVFAPTALAEPMQLPAGWMVRGFAPPGAIFAAGPNNSGSTVESNGWYYEKNPVGNRRMNLGNDTIASAVNKGNWVFPENGFFDPLQTDTGENRRNTFMVRFQAGSGRITGASVDPVIVLLPRNQIDWNTPGARPTGLTPAFTSKGDWRRIDFADNLPNWAKSVAKISEYDDIAALIGCRSADAALACSVNLLALYDESRMAQAIGARGVNKVTGCIYGGAVGTLNNASEVPKAPNIDLSLWPTTSLASGNAEYVQMLVNNYMLNALKYSDVESGGPATNLDADARLFRMDSYLGSIVETK
ncbi:MAG: prepilin-type N-terminal cleavage/methylation domain-containing protein [Phycisphaeraceae bacterium]|nr:prepilin-type N-terminal cleavage/methylation domain-containing protein [Phycisphaeraceae bacterium]